MARLVIAKANPLCRCLIESPQQILIALKGVQYYIFRLADSRHRSAIFLSAASLLCLAIRACLSVDTVAGDMLVIIRP